MLNLAFKDLVAFNPDVKYSCREDTEKMDLLLFDAAGKEIQKLKARNLERASADYVIMTSHDRKRGLLDRNFAVAIEPVYKSVRWVYGGYVCVESNGFPVTFSYDEV